MKYIFLYLILSYQLVLMAQVWTSEQSWSRDWESKYSKFIETEVSTEWIKNKNSIAYGYELDCARFIYFARLQFSFDNKLPFAFTDRKTGKVYSNDNFKINSNLSVSNNIKQFVKKLYYSVDSFTLAQDSFLVPLSKSYFKPGLILLGDFKKKHAWLLKKMTPSFTPTFIFSTLPQSSELYETYVFPTVDSTFLKGKNPSLVEGGFRQFKWPSEYQSNASRASQDQMNINLKDFFNVIQNKLRDVPRNPDEEFNYMLEDVCLKMRIRANVIIDTEHFKQKNKGRQLSLNERDRYSTHSRDKDIYNLFIRIDSVFGSQSKSLSKNTFEKYQSLLSPHYNLDSYCYVQWALNRIEPLGILRNRLLLGQMSSDAQDKYATRWGEEPND